MARPTFCAGVVAGLLTLAGARGASSADVYSIADFQAKLFHTNSGRFSQNVLTEPPATFQNGSTEDGDFAGTLLLIRIQGPPKQGEENLKLRVTARSAGKTLLDRTESVGDMNTSGNYYMAFWVYENPCDTLQVSARLILARPGPTVGGKIAFFCAE